GGGGDPAVAQHHRAIVQRRVFRKQRLYQRRRHVGVDRLASLDNRVERYVALDRDQGADALARQRFGRVGQLVRQRRRRVVDQVPQRTIAPQQDQPTPQLR